MLSRVGSVGWTPEGLRLWDLINNNKKKVTSTLRGKIISEVQADLIIIIIVTTDVDPDQDNKDWSNQTTNERLCCASLEGKGIPRELDHLKVKVITGLQSKSWFGRSKTKKAVDLPLFREQE